MTPCIIYSRNESAPLRGSWLLRHIQDICRTGRKSQLSNILTDDQHIMSARLANPEIFADTFGTFQDAFLEWCWENLDYVPDVGQIYGGHIALICRTSRDAALCRLWYGGAQQS